MITDDDVTELYRCLLNRAPETPDTVAAFKAYYPDFARGRRAILQSAEFAQLTEAEQGDTEFRVARAFLRRATASHAATSLRPRPDISGAMRLILRTHGAIRLAVVAGKLNMPAEDLLPLDSAHAVVLHITRDAPAKIPHVADLPGGGTLFRISFNAAGLAEFLTAQNLTIDLLAVFGNQPEWFSALRNRLAGRSILLSDTHLPDSIGAWQDAEQALCAAGLHLRFLGGWFLPVRYTPAAQPAESAPIPGLCIAAIMRNEAEAAPNMLASVAAIAESFAIIDTGSTDDTVARVEAVLHDTGKPFQLRTHPADRFDDMRNAALDLAPPTAQWVLMLDADEELCPEDHAALRDLLSHADHDAYALPRYNYTGADKSGEVSPYPDRQVRLLRNTPDRRLRYSGAVHETVRGADVVRLKLDAGALGQDRGGPHIHHLVRRFRSPEAEARKQAHYRDIAARHAAATPD